jgi:hypothetical protein
VFGFVSVRTQKLRAESRRLERIVSERTQEIRDRESEVRAQADELRRLDEIVKAINREEGLRNVLHALIEEGLKLVPQAEKGTFLIRDLKTDAFVFATQVGYDPDQLKGISLTEEDITHRYAQGTERVERGVYIVRPELNGEQKGRIGSLPLPRAMLAMSVALRGRLEGLLVFDNLHDENAFSHADLQRVSRLREHAINAVTKARTMLALQEKTLALQQQKEQMEQAYDNIELLSRIGRDIAAKLSIAGIIGTVYQNVNALMDAAVFGIGLHNEAEARPPKTARPCRRSATRSATTRGWRSCATAAGRRSSSGTWRASTSSTSASTSRRWRASPWHRSSTCRSCTRIAPSASSPPRASGSTRTPTTTSTSCATWRPTPRSRSRTRTPTGV